HGAMAKKWETGARYFWLPIPSDRTFRTSPTIFALQIVTPLAISVPICALKSKKRLVAIHLAPTSCEDVRNRGPIPLRRLLSAQANLAAPPDRNPENGPKRDG